ncbi:SMI1/KNR4 family protein [Clostridium estertheticum]|uniref:SMI1/KNR4 family protein n=1 Tax=Clostridium estertheticum TaxID=238834 RepID=UPI001CF1D3FE|nr:SMI1/KNR4 family protein [Clostridium estertheticum]MCB2355749.1 SMI1/KNR4 family protein [Clostridium estertheticum]WAG39338.1 SMI1/KNR4 family protein [Clostridium estertheticum]
MYKNLYKIDLKYEPATLEEIERIQKEFNMIFPEDYKGFLLYSNGADGEVGNNQLVVWDIQQIIDFFNELLKYMGEGDIPDILIFASDGATQGYGFIGENGKTSIISVDLDAIDIDYSEFCGNTFEEFLKHLSENN